MFKLSALVCLVLLQVITAHYDEEFESKFESIDDQSKIQKSLNTNLNLLNTKLGSSGINLLSKIKSISIIEFETDADEKINKESKQFQIVDFTLDSSDKKTIDELETSEPLIRKKRSHRNRSSKYKGIAAAGFQALFSGDHGRKKRSTEAFQKPSLNLLRFVRPLSAGSGYKVSVDAQVTDEQPPMMAPIPGPAMAYGQAPQVQAPMQQAYAPAPQAEAPMQQAYAPAPQVKAPMQQAYAPAPKAEAPMQQAYAPAPQAEAPMQQAYAPAPQAEAPMQQAYAPAPQAETPSYGYGSESGQRVAAALPNTCAIGFSEPVHEGEVVTETYCRCPSGTYGVSCQENFENPCYENGGQYFPADASLGPHYFIECNWNIPYLFKCPRTTIWSQDLMTCIHEYQPTYETAAQAPAYEQQQQQYY